MQDVINSVVNNRLVTIKGIPGIGKTTLAKAAAYFLDERQFFKEGIVMLSLRGLIQANMFVDRLFGILNKVMKLKEERSVHNTQIQQEKILEFLSDKEILIVIDNAEDTLKEDG